MPWFPCDRCGDVADVQPTRTGLLCPRCRGAKPRRPAHTTTGGRR